MAVQAKIGRTRLHCFKILQLPQSPKNGLNCQLSGSARGGSGIPVYPKKIHPNIPKIIPRYTLYSKFKESDVPNTRI